MYFLNSLIRSISLTVKELIYFPFTPSLPRLLAKRLDKLLSSYKTHHLSADLATNKDRIFS